MEWKPAIPRAVDLAQEIEAALAEAEQPQLAVAKQLAEHEHNWVKVDEIHQGMTQIRTYECRECTAHTTLTGPMGIVSPFEVEESTDG